MNRMVKELLRKQENERVEMATLLVSNTKEMLSNLGCDYMLSTSGTDVSKYETIINSLKEELKTAKNNVKTIEVVKEVEVPTGYQSVVGEVTGADTAKSVAITNTHRSSRTSFSI